MKLVAGNCHLYVFVPQRFNSMSVVFDFNASLNDAAPVSPILLSVDLMRMEKSVLLVGAICVLFLFCVHLPD